MRRLLASVLALAMGLGMASAPAAEARTVHGAQLPEPLAPIPGDETGTRFVVPTSLDRALRWLRRTYRRSEGVVIRRLRAPLRVEVYVIQNLRPNRTWDAINLYEDGASRTVYLTVLPTRRDR